MIEDADVSDAITHETSSDSDSDPERELDTGSVTVTYIKYDTLDKQQAVDCLNRASMHLQRQKTVNKYDKCSDIDTSCF